METMSCDSDRVCVEHVIDREPTLAYPFPGLKSINEKKVSQI